MRTSVGLARGGASPYATGGGGTVLEHRYGAVLLACLLTGDPVTELGDDATPVAVRFQASAVSPVDDLLVTGLTPDGGERKVSIGVRRAPGLVPSDDASARLLASYLEVVADQREALRSGRWRLCLAVAGPNTPMRQLAELAAIARASANEAQFRAEVARPGRTNDGVRERLGHVDALVEVARAGIEPAGVDAPELTWCLLSSLWVRELRLEGTDQTDRTHAVRALRDVTRARTNEAADQLFSRLAELASRYAPAGATVTRDELLRDLDGVPLTSSPGTHGTGMAADEIPLRPPLAFPAQLTKRTAPLSNGLHAGSLLAIQVRAHQELQQASITMTGIAGPPGAAAIPPPARLYWHPGRAISTTIAQGASSLISVARTGPMPPGAVMDTPDCDLPWSLPDGQWRVDLQLTATGYPALLITATFNVSPSSGFPTQTVEWLELNIA